MASAATQSSVLRPPVRVPLLLCLLILTGCAVGPNYQRPTTNLPESWQNRITLNDALDNTEQHEWWTLFDDPILNQLIEQTRNRNYSLIEAVSRIDEAYARVNIARGDFFPDLDAVGELTRTRVSKNVSSQLPPPRARADWFGALGAQFIWELDLWGRIRRSVEAANANLDASIEDYRDLWVFLQAEVAQHYILVRTLQQRLIVAHKNVDAQQQTLVLTQERLKAQISPELDVYQAKANLAETRSTLPTIRIFLAQALHRLAILTGNAPGSLYTLLNTPQAVPDIKNFGDIIGPNELIKQRPDIRRAERLLASQTALIGVAKANLWPSINIFGNLSFESFDSLGDMFMASSKAYVLGPTIGWNLLDAGRVRGNISAQEAKSQQLIAGYQQTILRALEEVENALVSYQQETLRTASLRDAVNATIESTKRVHVLYKSGLTDFQNVLDTERLLFQQEDLYTQSLGNKNLNLIALFKALGVGWQSSKPAAKATKEQELKSP